MVEKVISSLTSRKFFFDSDVPMTYILKLVTSKLIAFARGCLKYHMPIFLGSGTVINCKSKLILVSNNVAIGRYSTLDALSVEGIVLGDNFKLGDFSKIICSGTLRDLGKGVKVGSNVAIGEYSYIGGAGGVEIGDDCIFGQYLSIHPENHNYSNNSVLIRDQGVKRQGIRIGNNCWFGAKVTICDGVEIGDNSIVAAGSVVTKSFPDNCVIGGVPAKCIKMK